MQKMGLKNEVSMYLKYSGQEEAAEEEKSEETVGPILSVKQRRSPSRKKSRPFGPFSIVI
jgi:hypothetical protein